MPEGDTIHNHANRMAPLVGQPVLYATTQGIDRDLGGRHIAAIFAHGKHLLIDLDDGTRIRTHLGMPGRIRVYPPADGEAVLARSSPGHAMLVIATPIGIVIWWKARTVEILSRRAPNRDLALARLGPDILAPAFAPDAAADRAAAHGSRPMVEILLDQTIVAGIGNIYKNETLFARSVAPLAPVSALARGELIEVFATAQRLMVARDRTRHVYGRTGEPCERCRTAIRRAELGVPARTTWWCPSCQQVGTSTGTSLAGAADDR